MSNLLLFIRILVGIILVFFGIVCGFAAIWLAFDIRGETLQEMILDGMIAFLTAIGALLMLALAWGIYTGEI